MLFLINDQVFDVADPQKSATEHLNLLTGAPLHMVSAAAAIEIGRELFFQAGNDRPMKKILFALAALLADRTEANAVLFVRAPEAQSRNDVFYRIADVPITTLSYLNQRKMGETIAPEIVNEAIWLQVA